MEALSPPSSTTTPLQDDQDQGDAASGDPEETEQVLSQPQRVEQEGGRADDVEPEEGRRADEQEVQDDGDVVVPPCCVPDDDVAGPRFQKEVVGKRIRVLLEVVVAATTIGKKCEWFDGQITSFRYHAKPMQQRSLSSSSSTQANDQTSIIIIHKWFHTVRLKQQDGDVVQRRLDLDQRWRDGTCWIEGVPDCPDHRNAWDEKSMVLAETLMSEEEEEESEEEEEEEDDHEEEAAGDTGEDDDEEEDQKPSARSKSHRRGNNDQKLAARRSKSNGGTSSTTTKKRTISSSSSRRRSRTTATATARNKDNKNVGNKTNQKRKRIGKEQYNDGQQQRTTKKKKTKEIEKEEVTTSSCLSGATHVRRRVRVNYTMSDGSHAWYDGVIVDHTVRRRISYYHIHFDDGDQIWMRLTTGGYEFII